MAIRAGELRHELIIESKSGPKVRTGDGGFATPFVPFGDPVRGSFKELSGRELETAKSMDNRSTHEIKMRFLSGLTSKMRFTFNSKIYNIANINDVDERGVWQKVLVFEDKA